MAKVIKGSDEVKIVRYADNKMNPKAIIILILLILAALFSYMSIKTNSLLFLVFILFCVAAIIIIAVFSKQNTENDSDEFVIPETEQERYGAIGELKTGIYLQEILPDDFTVIQNTVVHYNGGQSEIDNIVIGKTGIFIIEVKTMKGKVYADYDAHDWKKVKTDKYGIEHEKEFYSPVKQVGTHVYRLAKTLRGMGIYTYVRAVVYFSDPDTDVIISGEEKDTPIFTYQTRDKMRDYLCNSGQILTMATINKAVNFLSNNR
jgi:Ca2+/Na+ antiporter